MIFKAFLGAQFFILSVSIAEITSSLTDDIENGIASEIFEYSSNDGDQSGSYASEEENYDLIFEDEESPGSCSRILHRRLMQFLKNARGLNSTRKGRQDDEGGDDGDDGDGGDAAGAAAPVEVLGLELPAAVPQFFKVVANALVSNESAATIDMGFKALAPILQNQVTGAVSLFANVLQGGSPFASQGPQPTRPAAPIRQWPSNTRRPRPRPSQSPFRPNRPSYSEEEEPEEGGTSAVRVPVPSGQKGPTGERKPAAGVIPPRRRRTTISPGKQSTSKEEETESDVQSPLKPPGISVPIIRNPSAGSLNRFYASTQKIDPLTPAESFPPSAGGGSLKNFYSTTPKFQEAGDTNSQSQIGSLNQFYSTTSKAQEFPQSAQIGSLNQFYSPTSKVIVQESAQSELESPQPPIGGSLNQFYAPKPQAQESSQAEPEPQAQIGSLNQFYSTTAKAQEELETEQEPQAQVGSLNQMYSTTVKVQESEQGQLGQIGSLKNFYAGTSKVKETPAAEVEQVAEENGPGSFSKNIYPTVAPESNNEEAESETEGDTGSGSSLKQFYSSTPNVKVKVIVQPENSAGQGSPPKQTGSIEEQNEEHVQWGALRRFYSTSTIVPPQVRFPESEGGQEKFASALLGSLSQIRRKPAAPVSPVVNSQNEVSTPEDKFASLFKPIPPVTNAAPVASSSPPKRRRRTTSTTESEYYDEETEKPANKT